MFSVEELDRFITQSRDLLRRGGGLLRHPDLGILVLALEQAAVAWAIATRIDLERTQTGTHLRGGDSNLFDRLRRLSKGSVEGEWMPSVMASIALAVNDSALAAAAGEGSHPGDHAQSLHFAELWCRQVEEALEPMMALMETNTWVFADTPEGRRAKAISTDSNKNRAYLAWVKRVVGLRRRNLILDPKTVRARSFYARIGPEPPVSRDKSSELRVARALSTTAREILREAMNKRRLILRLDSTAPGEIFVTDPRPR